MHRLLPIQALLSLGLLLSLAPGQALAEGGKSIASNKRPSLSLTMPHTVNETAPIPISWSASHLGRHYKLVIQRPFGTARTWRSILRLKASSGTAELPGKALGKYRFRIAAYRGWRLLAQQVVGIGVYGQVPFTTLLRNGYLTSGGLENGVYATPTTSFPYVGSSIVGEHGRPNTIFSAIHNRCVEVHVGFVLGEARGELYRHPESLYGIVRLVQQSRDPVATEAPLNGIGSVDAQLTPGQTWSLQVEENDRDGVQERAPVYFNGYAICDSTESFFS